MSETSTLYRKVYNYIVTSLSDGVFRVGDKLPSEHALANEIQVSRLTVRKAYQMLTAEGVLSTHQGKGTFIASLPVEIEHEFSNNKTITLIFPESTMFFGAILKELEQQLTNLGYQLNVMINSSPERDIQAIQKVLAERPAGVIISALRQKGKNEICHYEQLLASNIPVVMIGRPPEGIACDHVYCNDTRSCYKAISTLIASDKKNLLYLENPLDDPYAYKERHTGFYQAVNEHCENTTVTALNIHDQNFNNQLTEVISSQEIDIVFTTYEYTALDVYNQFITHNLKMPQIVCFLNTDLVHQLKLPFHTLEIPKQSMARTALELLLSKLKHDNSCKKDYITQLMFEPLLFFINQ